MRGHNPQEDQMSRKKKYSKPRKTSTPPKARRAPSSQEEWARVIEGPLAFCKQEAKRGLARINELAPATPQEWKQAKAATVAKLTAILSTLEGGGDV
jgi:hypothetical protein